MKLIFLHIHTIFLAICLLSILQPGRTQWNFIKNLWNKKTSPAAEQVENVPSPVSTSQATTNILSSAITNPVQIQNTTRVQPSQIGSSDHSTKTKSPHGSLVVSSSNNPNELPNERQHAIAYRPILAAEPVRIIQQPYQQPVAHPVLHYHQPVAHRVQPYHQPVAHRVQPHHQPVAHHVQPHHQPVAHHVQPHHQPVAHPVQSHHQPVAHLMQPYQSGNVAYHPQTNNANAEEHPIVGPNPIERWKNVNLRLIHKSTMVLPKDMALPRGGPKLHEQRHVHRMVDPMSQARVQQSFPIAPHHKVGSHPNPVAMAHQYAQPHEQHQQFEHSAVADQNNYVPVVNSHNNAHLNHILHGINPQPNHQQYESHPVVAQQGEAMAPALPHGFQRIESAQEFQQLATPVTRRHEPPGHHVSTENIHLAVNQPQAVGSEVKRYRGKTRPEPMTNHSEYDDTEPRKILGAIETRKEFPRSLLNASASRNQHAKGPDRHPQHRVIYGTKEDANNVTAIKEHETPKPTAKGIIHKIRKSIFSKEVILLTGICCVMLILVVIALLIKLGKEGEKIANEIQRERQVKELLNAPMPSFSVLKVQDDISQPKSTRSQRMSILPDEASQARSQARSFRRSFQDDSQMKSNKNRQPSIIPDSRMSRTSMIPSRMSMIPESVTNDRDEVKSNKSRRVSIK